VFSCLKKCGKEYCIMERLKMAQGGDVEDGLVFAGSSAARIHDIPTVAELMERLEPSGVRPAGKGSDHETGSITGIGVVSPIGIGKESFADSLEQGRSGVGTDHALRCERVHHPLRRLHR
jgi:hypothetical protein